MTTDDDGLAPPDSYAGQVLDAQLHLLDRQVLDTDGVPVTTVDDLEITDIPIDEPLRGTPAPIKVASWRVVMAMSSVLMRPPASLPKLTS